MRVGEEHVVAALAANQGAVSAAHAVENHVDFFEDLDSSDQLIMDAMLETLTQILYLDEERCGNYALHGLNHLPHPRRAATVQKFIDLHCADWDDAALAWVESCRDGEAM